MNAVVYQTQTHPMSNTYVTKNIGIDKVFRCTHFLLQSARLERSTVDICQANWADAAAKKV